MVDLCTDPKAASCTCVMLTVGRHRGVLPYRSVFRYGLLQQSGFLYQLVICSHSRACLIEIGIVLGNSFISFTY